VERIYNGRRYVRAKRKFREHRRLSKRIRGRIQQNQKSEEEKKQEIR